MKREPGKIKRKKKKNRQKKQAFFAGAYPISLLPLRKLSAGIPSIMPSRTQVPGTLMHWHVGCPLRQIETCLIDISIIWYPSQYAPAKNAYLIRHLVTVHWQASKL
jgi:hypothetical protein